MSTSIILAERINGTLRIIIGLFSFFASGFMLLVAYGIATNGLLNNVNKTLGKAISDEPEILFIFSFLILIMVAAGFSFLSGLFHLNIKQEGRDRKLKWDLYFWISFVCISIPLISGVIFEILI